MKPTPIVHMYGIQIWLQLNSFGMVRGHCKLVQIRLEVLLVHYLLIRFLLIYHFLIHHLLLTGWFQDLSAKFLSARAAKLLVLAGTDRLDKTLMIGSMQGMCGFRADTAVNKTHALLPYFSAGKFQMDIFAEAGHAIHEDQPDRLAQCLVEFGKRNKRLVLPPKAPLKASPSS